MNGQAEKPVMLSTRLAGRSGWFLVASLTVVLAGLVGLQLRPAAAHADAVVPVPVPVALAADVGAPAEAPPDPNSSPEPSAAADLPTAPPQAAPRVPQPAPVRMATAAPLVSDICGGADWQRRRGLRALATLRHPTPAGVTVALRPGTRGFLGLTYPQRHHVDLFVRSCGAESWALLRHVAAHEMGHAYDATHMTAASRAAYEARRGIPAGTPWFGCSYCTDFATPAGDFAETYAQWQRGSSDSRTQIAAVPGPAALARIGAEFFSD